jgi:Fe-S-cluster containining protein
MMQSQDFKVINGIKIDPKIFTFKFSCKCNGECCYYGVYTDSKEYENILSIKDELIPLFDETQNCDIDSWFEPPEKDEDFESGVAVGTEVYKGKCTFLDKDGLCTLQKLANLNGEFKWKYKPIYCVLFPFTVYENMLTIDDEHIDRLKHCNKNSTEETTIFEACKEELQHFFDEEGFKQLEDYRDEVLESQNIESK